MRKRKGMMMVLLAAQARARQDSERQNTSQKRRKRKEKDASVVALLSLRHAFRRHIPRAQNFRQAPRAFVAAIRVREKKLLESSFSFFYFFFFSHLSVVAPSNDEEPAFYRMAAARPDQARNPPTLALGSRLVDEDDVRGKRVNNKSLEKAGELCKGGNGELQFFFSVSALLTLLDLKPFPLFQHNSPHANNSAYAFDDEPFPLLAGERPERRCFVRS